MSGVLDPDGVIAGDAIDLYRAAGWARTFPLPAREKDPPPGGITGQHGTAPDAARLAEFRRAPVASNVGIAMPQDLIGVDVDQYGAKRGADNLRALCDRLKITLPPTVRSTNRGSDNPSGIYIYRVPPGFFWRGAPVPGVELIAWHERYAVVWPSIHPEARDYLWYDDAGELLDRVPLVAGDYPDLPWELVKVWTRAEEEPADFEPAAPQHADRADWHPKVTAKMAEYTNRNGASCHDTALGVSMALCRYEQFELAGATTALVELGRLFIADVTHRDNPHKVAGEWGRMLSGGRVRAQTTQSTSTPPTPPTPAVAELDDDFWTARPYLEHIRAAAWSRGRAPAPLLHVMLARVSAIVPHTVVLPAIVGAVRPLAYFAALVAPTGTGKSSALDIAEELLPLPDWVVGPLPPGSGEGLAEALYGFVDDGGGKSKKKVRAAWNGYIVVDEGQALAEIAGRKGATMYPALRTIWTGGTLGQANATDERKRIVAAGSYVFGLVAAFQPTTAGGLVDDAGNGTPGRFGWAFTVDPGIPPPGDRPAWPGRLDWTPPARTDTGGQLAVHPDIAHEVAERDYQLNTGQDTVDDINAHIVLYRLKVAGLLAVLDSRRNIDLDDWALAGRIQTASVAARERVINTLAHEATREEHRRREQRAGRETHVDDARERRTRVRAAERIAEVVWKHGEMTAAKVRRRMSTVLAGAFEPGLEDAIAAEWVVEYEAPGQGTPRRMLRPGEKRP